MDYMKLINKSLQNAWKYKFLWLFGFFVSATDGGGGSRGGINLDSLDIDPVILISIIICIFLIIILLFLLSVFSEGALIHGISRKELNLKTNFSDCFSAGLGKFFRLFGIKLLAGLIGLSAVICLAIFLIPVFLASVWLGIALCILLLPLFFVIIFIIVAVEGWAMRFALLNEKTWLDAIGNGWNLLKANVGRTLGVAFSSFLTKFLFGILLVVGLLILAIPFILIGTVNLWLGLIPGVLFALLIIIPFAAYFGTFGSSVWTLGFMEMTGYTALLKVKTSNPDKAKRAITD